MKTSLHFMIAAGLVILAACAKKDEPSGGGNVPTPVTVATSPNQGCNVPGQTNCAPVQPYNCNIPGQTNCDPNYYNQNMNNPNNPWMAPQPYQWENNNGVCGCPDGYIPTRNPQWGYGCVMISAMNSGYNQYQQPYVFYNFRYGFNYPTQNGQQNNYVPPAQNGQSMNLQQSTYQPVISGRGNCSVNAASACDVRIANSCGPNATCRAVSGGSTMGLCTSGYGQDYVPHNGCRWVSHGQGYSYWRCNGSYYNQQMGGGYYGGPQGQVR